MDARRHRKIAIRAFLSMLIIGELRILYVRMRFIFSFYTINFNGGFD